MSNPFAKRVDLLKASEVREMLKIAEQPGVISFAGGLPAPELFPVEEMKEVTTAVLTEAGSAALQYSKTEGFAPLRERIAARMNRKFKTDVAADDILITSGSQQVLDLAGKIFLDKDDVVLCESPTYLAAISAFRSYEPRFVEIPTDDQGMRMDELEKILANTPKVKLIYVIPDFQNPTGRTWPIERRKKFMEIVTKYEIPVIEDNPYGELRFEGEIAPSLKAFDPKGMVLFAGTFSKVFCPGLRVGWVVAKNEFLEKLIQVKQSADLHTSSLSQRIIAKYMEMYDFEANLERIVELYRGRRNVMIGAMKKYFPEQVKFTEPEGGLFTWAILPENMNANELLQKCIEHNVVFVPGDSFFPNGGASNRMRLNYSNMPDEKIVEGIQRLAAAIREAMA